MIDQTIDQTERYRALRITHDGDLTELGRGIVREHRALMESAIARDPLACDMLTEHLESTCRAVRNILLASVNA